MKTLPDNPNLDHLRRQAKDLLAGLRDSHPDASLADAQASLAEQYGFRTWTDLKAEVDRRQGAAEVADPVLAGQIAAHSHRPSSDRRSAMPPLSLDSRAEVSVNLVTRVGYAPRLAGRLEATPCDARLGDACRRSDRPCESGR